ncbi:hypothetical protein EU703_22370 [Salmonella enterica]|nr:hypothetical protein [Salmonella enterica]
MIRQGFILTTAMLLSGCGYHFANQVDAYDLMPRPVTNKRFQIVPPDESIQSRMFSGRFADGLAKNVNAKIIGRFSPFLMSAIGH